MALIDYAPLIALLFVAAAEDIRARRVPNWISLGLLISGLGLSCTSWGHITVSQALGGLAVGFGIALVLHLLGAIGAGDVKLLAGVGVWVGPIAVLLSFAGAAIVGMFLAIAISIRNGRLKDVVRGGVLLGASITGGTHGFGTRPALSADREIARRRSLPFAVAIAIATVSVLVVQCSLAGRTQP